MIVFAFAVAILTVAGHLMWLMFAAIFRALGVGCANERANYPLPSEPRPLTAAEKRQLVLSELGALRRKGQISSEVYDSVFKVYLTVAPEGTDSMPATAGARTAFEQPTLPGDRTAEPDTTRKVSEYKLPENPQLRSPASIPPPLPARKEPALKMPDIAPVTREFNAKDEKPSVLQIPATPESAKEYASAVNPQLPSPASIPPPLPARKEPVLRMPEAATAEVGNANTRHEKASVLQIPVMPDPPKASLADMLSAFMESKHIRWGELIGGMLIVLCSAALVVSFWSAIVAIPLLKFGLFTGVTGAIFGCALFMEHRWKMPATSKGLLLTATMLVPLNFLAMAAFSGDTGTLPLIGKALAFLVFGVLMFYGAKILVSRTPIALPAGVLVSSIPLLVLGVFSLQAWGWVLLPVLAFGVCTLWPLYSMSKSKDSQEDGWLGLVGAVFFAALLSVGFIAFKTGHAWDLLRDTSPFLCIFSATFLAGGIWMWTKENQSEAMRLTGTGMTVLGAVVIILCGVLATPAVLQMICISLFGFGVLFIVGQKLHLSEAHAPAAAALALALCLAGHVAGGELTLGISSLSILAGAILGWHSLDMYFVIAAIFFGVGFTLKGRSGYWYFVAAAVSACFHIALATYYGFGRTPDHGAIVVYPLAPRIPHP